MAFQAHIRRYAIQIIGALALLGAYWFLLVHYTFWMCYLLILAGAFDLFLIYIKKDITISTYTRKLLGYNEHTIIWIILMAMILPFRGWDVLGIATIGLLINHLSLNDDIDKK